MEAVLDDRHIIPEKYLHMTQEELEAEKAKIIAAMPPEERPRDYTEEEIRAHHEQWRAELRELFRPKG